MNLIELTYPAGALDETQRQAIADAIVSHLLAGPDAPREAIERAGRATHVWFHAATTWTTGAGPVQSETAFPLVVTITVPDAWRDELAPHAIGAVRAALVRHVPAIVNGSEAGLWINVLGVRDGCIGLNGKPTTSTDIVRYLTHDLTLPDDSDLRDGVLIDPVCGMHVHLGKGTISLDHDGHTIAFCATGCRNVYAQDHNITIDEKTG
ncbi:MAG: hypothetical protein ACRDQA_06880 [Nocardioidaceae bacterium]